MSLIGTYSQFIPYNGPAPKQCPQRLQCRTTPVPSQVSNSHEQSVLARDDMESGIDISSGDREPTRMQECKQEQEDGNEECLDSQGSQGSQENPIVVLDNDSDDDSLPSLDELFGPTTTNRCGVVVDECELATNGVHDSIADERSGSPEPPDENNRPKSLNTSPEEPVAGKEVDLKGRDNSMSVNNAEYVKDDNFPGSSYGRVVSTEKEAQNGCQYGLGDEDEQDQWEIERVIKKRRGPYGEEYKVCWARTWVRKEDMRCDDLIKAFERRRGNRMKVTQVHQKRHRPKVEKGMGVSGKRRRL